MSKNKTWHCEFATDHSPNTICESCHLDVDRYGNTEQDFVNCCFPDCGCDGHRCCDAPSGSNSDSLSCNVESMWSRKDKEAVISRETLIMGCRVNVR